MTDIEIAKNTARIPKIKVERFIKNQFNPKIIPSAAPNDAPLKTPKIPGETKGFTNIAWKEAPATAKEAPIKIAEIILGNLISKITLFIVSYLSIDIEELNPNNFWINIKYSFKLISYCPKKNEAFIVTIKVITKIK